eukprot:m.301788 g.301788  ORF g.301788 m.301788 type:complete len:382 (+) comp14921_c0_seq1:214-1359(+)
MVCGGCELDPVTRNVLVALVTITAGSSTVVCLWVLLCMWALRRRHFPIQRVLHSVFVANLLFSITWLVPLHHGTTYSSIEIESSWRCLLGGLYDGTRFLCAFVEFRLISFSYYCSRLQREAVTKYHEKWTLSVAWFLSTTVFTFFVAFCWRTHEEEDGPSRNQYDTISIVFLCFVAVIALLRLMLYIEVQYQQSIIDSQHREAKASLMMAHGSEPSAADLAEEREVRFWFLRICPRPISKLVLPERKSSGNNERIMNSVLKPLQTYPTVFLLTIAPQVIILIVAASVDSNYKNQLTRAICHIFIPWRGFLNSLVYMRDNSEILDWRRMLEKARHRWNNPDAPAEGSTNVPLLQNEQIRDPEFGESRLSMINSFESDTLQFF